MVSQLKQLCLLIVLLLAVTNTHAQRREEHARRLRRASLDVFEILPEEHRALGGTTPESKGKGSKSKGEKSKGKGSKAEKSKGKGEKSKGKGEKSTGKGKGSTSSEEKEHKSSAVRSVDEMVVTTMAGPVFHMEVFLAMSMSMSMSMSM